MPRRSSQEPRKQRKQQQVLAFKQSLKNTVVAGGETLLTEGATEGYQTPVENRMVGKPTTKEDI